MAAYFIFLFKKSLILGLEYSLCELGLWKEKHFLYSGGVRVSLKGKGGSLAGVGGSSFKLNGSLGLFPLLRNEKFG